MSAFPVHQEVRPEQEQATEELQGRTSSVKRTSKDKIRHPNRDRTTNRTQQARPDDPRPENEGDHADRGGHYQ